MLNFANKKILTFDCYGTLIDWETGLTGALQPILKKYGVNLPDQEMLEIYGEYEAEAEKGSYMTYREVLSTVIGRFGKRFGFTPTGEEVSRFAASVGDWPAFPDTAAALADLKKCFKLA